MATHRKFGGLRGQFVFALGAILCVGISIVVLISQNTFNLDPSLQSAIITPLLVAIGSLTLLFAYAFFTYSVMRPVRALDVSTRRAANGDFASPVTLLPQNEFGELGESFNAMLHEIEAQRDALKAQLATLQETNDELVSTHAELKDTNTSLIRSERLASVGQLAAGIAHEIGNPLAAIQGYAELVGDGNLDSEERIDVAKRMGTQLDRIHEIIRNLLDFSRDEAQIPQSTDLAACIDETLSLVRAMPKARAIAFVIEPTINVNAAGVHNTMAQAVPNLVVQILLNLCLNAIDAIKSERKFGTVKIRVSEHSEHVELRIVDDGPGVHEDVANTIFDPFFTTKEPGEGTGLGLSIVHRMMDSMGGDIVLEPSKRGATFLLQFRRADTFDYSEE